VRAVERASLTSLLGDRCDVDPLALAGRLCSLCAVAIGVSGVALVVVGKVHRSTVCASDAVSAALEDLAFACSEGPSVEAARHGRAVLVADLATEPSRWPWFAPAAERAGARAIFAFPLYLSDCLVGVLVLYRATPGGLAPEEVRDAWTLAEAACALLSTEEPASAGVMGSAWVVGNRSSFPARVHQAVGVTMDDLHLDAVDALALVAAHSFVTGEPIRVTAERILTQNLRLEQV